MHPQQVFPILDLPLRGLLEDGTGKCGHLESAVCREEELELEHAPLLLCLSHLLSYWLI